MIGSDYVIICLSVDDMLIFGTNVSVVNEAKTLLSSLFEMKDLREANVILGSNLIKPRVAFPYVSLIALRKILKRFNSFDVVPVRTPFDPSTHIKKNRGSSVSQVEYAKIIGSMMFFINYMCPYIAYGISRLSRYTHNPAKEHWDVLHRLLRYLRGTMDWCCTFS